MSGQQHHIIHSLRYEVQFEDSLASNQQDALSRAHYDYALSHLSEVFDSLSTSDKYIHINRLELDLGIISRKNWQTTFTEQLGKQLTKKLGNEIIRERSNSGPSVNGSENHEVDDISLLSIEEREEDIFFFFLQNGYLKWTARKDQSISINDIFEKIIGHKSENFEKQFKYLLLHSEISLRRFLLQIHPKLQWQWLKKILPAAGEFFKDISALQKPLIKNLGITKSISNKIGLWLEKNLIHYVLQKDIETFSEEEFIKSCSDGFYTTFSNDLKIPEKVEIPNVFEQSENKLLQLLIPLFTQNSNDSDKRNYKDKKTGDLPLKEDGKGYIIIPGEDLRKGIFITNSGLILLWPYLHALFSEFHLIKESNFKGLKEKTSALFMLHYLATGIRKAEEHELLVPKILTDYDHELAVPADVILEDTVYDECDKLLNTFIKQWAILKSTSPDGLRQTFLQRKALIKTKEDGWHFMFERMGLDVLLDGLPFGISIIKLKWLEKPLYVSW